MRMYIHTCTCMFTHDVNVYVYILQVIAPGMWVVARLCPVSSTRCFLQANRCAASQSPTPQAKFGGFMPGSCLPLEEKERIVTASSSLSKGTDRYCSNLCHLATQRVAKEGFLEGVFKGASKRLFLLYYML